MPHAVNAQNSEIDRAYAGAPSLGTFPTGGTVTGSDGTSATVSRTITTSEVSTFTPVSFAGDYLSYIDTSGFIDAVEVFYDDDQPEAAPTLLATALYGLSDRL